MLASKDYAFNKTILFYRLDYLVGTTVNILLRSPHSWHNIGRAYFIKLQSVICNHLYHTI